MTEKQKVQIRRMRVEGMGYKAIAAELSLPTATVSSYFRRAADKPKDSCLQCGKPLSHSPHRKKKKFCSDKCRMLWWHSHPKELNMQAYYTAVCQHCGKEFVVYGNDHRKYCSRGCYGLSRRKAKSSI